MILEYRFKRRQWRDSLQGCSVNFDFSEISKGMAYSICNSMIFGVPGGSGESGEGVDSSTKILIYYIFQLGWTKKI